MPIQMESRKTKFNCAGGERVENVAYLPLSKMQEILFTPEKYFSSL